MTSQPSIETSGPRPAASQPAQHAPRGISRSAVLPPTTMPWRLPNLDPMEPLGSTTDLGRLAEPTARPQQDRGPAAVSASQGGAAAQLVAGDAQLAERGATGQASIQVSPSVQLTRPGRSAVAGQPRVTRLRQQRLALSLLLLVAVLGIGGGGLWWAITSAPPSTGSVAVVAGRLLANTPSETAQPSSTESTETSTHSVNPGPSVPPPANSTGNGTGNGNGAGDKMGNNSGNNSGDAADVDRPMAGRSDGDPSMGDTMSPEAAPNDQPPGGTAAETAGVPVAIWEDVHRQLRAARALAQQRAWTKAQQQLDVIRQKLAPYRVTAEQDADNLPAAVRRLAEVVSQAEEYWRGVEDGWQRLQAGQELQINGRIMIVVEIDSQKLILRDAGRNRTIARSDIPGRLAVYLANSTLQTDSASNRLLAIAFTATETDFAEKTLREQWEAAAAAGADVGDLPRVLDDDYDRQLEQHVQAAGGTAESPE